MVGVAIALGEMQQRPEHPSVRALVHERLPATAARLPIGCMTPDRSRRVTARRSDATSADQF
jgi:hypothetical protein